MTQFFAAFEDLFKSIYELFASIIGAFAHAIQAVVNTILNFFSGIINLFTDVFKGVVDVVGGVGSFVLSKSIVDATRLATIEPEKLTREQIGNVVVIGVLAAGYVIYTRQQQGKPIIPAKKTN